MSDNFNLFQAMGTILKGSELPEHNKQKIASFMMLRWLAGDRRVIQAANVVNRYCDIPVNLQYDMFRQMLHGKINFIKYPKGAKNESSETMELIQKHYNVSSEKALEMQELISKDEVKYLKELYK